MVNSNFYFGFFVISIIGVSAALFFWFLKYKEMKDDEPDKKKIWKESLIACFVVFGVFGLMTLAFGFYYKNRENKTPYSQQDTEMSRISQYHPSSDTSTSDVFQMLAQSAPPYIQPTSPHYIQPPASSSATTVVHHNYGNI